jgi:two-component system, cell cycle sensor histidine kinase and response regulator CckA
MNTPMADKLQVLIAAASAPEARALGAALRQAGYSVCRPVTSGAEALRKAAAGRIDLVLIDLPLPGSPDGLETAVRLRAGHNLPVVLTTPAPDRQTLARIRGAVPLACLIKPVAPAQLAAAADLALALFDAGREDAAQRRRLHITLNCIAEGVITADVEGRVTFLNPVAEQLTGWRRDDAVGRPLATVFHTIDEHRRARVETPEVRALRDDTAILEEPEDVLLVSFDGVERPILSTASPINDEQGNLLGVVVVFRDIASRRQVERRRLDRQRMEALGRLSSNIAHEFGNLLAVIGGHATAMGEYLLPKSRAHEDARRIVEATAHGTTLTRRILGVARASDIEGDLDIRPVPAGEVIRQAVELFREQFEERKIVVTVRGADTMPTVLADRDHLVDLVMDLCMNAADAMPKGGELTIDARSQQVLRPDKKLNVHARPGRYGVLRFQDTGVGMPPATLERIFEPFFTTKQADQHVGLGLSIVQSAIHRYGGWIRVTSEPGQGSMFAVFLPQASEAARKAAEHEARPAGGTILVADDDEGFRHELRDLLQGAGYKVHLAAGGAEAIELYHKLNDKLDLAIIDVIMPDKDGKEVLHDVLRVDPTKPVIMTSGFSREYVRTALPKGSWRFLQKPFDPEQVLLTVRRALDQKTS